jgi:hypothetical protein
MSSSSASGSQQQQQSPKPTPEQVRAAAQAISSFLGSQVYAVVGGAACSLLGSSRVTEDVDVVVPQGATKETRQKLKSQAAYFDVEKRTLHTYYKSTPPVEVEILAPPSLFKENFSSSTPVVVVNGIKVLKPALILNAKCYSIIGRASEDKKRTDALDIQFCLWWCAQNNAFPTGAEVPRASKEFVEWFVSGYGGQELWLNARYNFETGK